MQFETIEELLNYTQSKGLFEPLVKQVIKDFGLVGVTLHIPEPWEVNAFSERITEKLYLLIMEQNRKYVNLLYRMDVAEKELGPYKSDTVEEAKRMTGIVLNRALRKVQFRADEGNQHF
ncbi:MAG: hypothetical protein AAFU57_03245 [Bacteroidota bacterium]